MKTSILKFLTLVVITTFTSCGEKAKEADTKAAKAAVTAEATAITYNANPENSKIEWKGFKPTGSHNGVISIAEGMVTVTDGKVKSGKFTIDMTSISVTDIPVEDEGNAKLAGHLKNADFFDVEAYPNAKFEVTGIKTNDGKTMLSGNLTIKEVTNNITFFVQTAIKDSTMTLTSETFTIDRSKWQIKYGSKSFFDNLGDRFINDDIELKVTLVANKA